MKRNAFAATLCLAALTLGACSETDRLGGNSKICVDFKEAKGVPVAATADGSTAVDECVRRWAYSLATSRDEAAVVAEAAAAACSVQLSRWNQTTLAQPNAEGEATSILTGLPTTPLAEHNAFAQSRALLYVVQARAGNCAPPPAANGVPEGVS